MIAADPEWMDLAAAAGHEVRAVSALTHRELRGAEAVVVRAADAWARLRTWRLGGLSVGVVVVDERGDSPDDRTRLEPVVVLRRRDRPGFVEALERLRVGEAPARVVLATGTADFHRQVFERVDGTLVHLTGLEARLLAYLAARSFRVVGRDELQEQVWGYRRSMPTKAVEASVGRLRKKVEQGPGSPRWNAGLRRLAAGSRPQLVRWRRLDSRSGAFAGAGVGPAAVNAPGAGECNTHHASPGTEIARTAPPASDRRIPHRQAPGRAVARW